ncbi:DUF3592 domain-containing protein [Dactylosporangium sp. NPDC051541]|uniref:DUF3592 domain-containing protein n=1 Tax=Dactylosporangium sp. NPDC051541 TaxID=3363977 RepID=UPI0037B47C9E
MSTIDPVQRERDPAGAARRRTVRTALMLACALIAGYGMSVDADFPGSSISFGAGEPWAVLKSLLLLAGLTATMLLIGVIVRLPEQPGPRGEPTFILGSALLAVTAGLLIGTFLPSSFREFADTDLSDARTNVRVTCAFLVIVAVALFGWAILRSRRRQHTAQLRKTGRRVSAEVTEVHDTGFTTNNAPRVRLTVRFTDATGTNRYVRRHLSVSRFDRPGVGDRIPLWYDPNDPGNEKKIVVGTQSAR